MRKLLPLALLLTGQALAQSTPKSWYFTSSGEWIFSSAILDVGPDGNDQGSIIRFSPVFNALGMANHDFSEHAGMFIGLGVRNVGFIYDVPDSEFRYKFRPYNLGVPVGLKFGDMDGGMVYLGYEMELPFNYKEKEFQNEKKEDKFNVWFSDRTEPLMHTLFLGVQFKYGTSLKFKYYLTNFHNTDFTETKDGVTTKPYAGLNANIIYVSLSFGLFGNGGIVTEVTHPANTEARLITY